MPISDPSRTECAHVADHLFCYRVLFSVFWFQICCYIIFITQITVNTAFYLSNNFASFNNCNLMHVLSCFNYAVINVRKCIIMQCAAVRR